MIGPDEDGKIHIDSLWVEAVVCMIVAIYVHGWLNGFLIASGLTSLLHVLVLLKGIFGVMRKR